MFALVRFLKSKDYYICSLDSVKCRRSKPKAPFKDGKYRKVRIITIHASLKLLQSLKDTLCRDKKLRVVVCNEFGGLLPAQQNTKVETPCHQSNRSLFENVNPLMSCSFSSSSTESRWFEHETEKSGRLQIVKRQLFSNSDENVELAVNLAELYDKDNSDKVTKVNFDQEVKENNELVHLEGDSDADPDYVPNIDEYNSDNILDLEDVGGFTDMEVIENGNDVENSIGIASNTSEDNGDKITKVNFDKEVEENNELVHLEDDSDADPDYVPNIDEYNSDNILDLEDEGGFTDMEVIENGNDVENSIGIGSNTSEDNGDKITKVNFDKEVEENNELVHLEDDSDANPDYIPNIDEYNSDNILDLEDEGGFTDMEVIESGNNVENNCAGIASNTSDLLKDKLPAAKILEDLTNIIETSVKLLPEQKTPYYKKDIEILTVPSVSGKSGRRHFCIYCKKFYARLPDHLEAVHVDEEAVKQFCGLPKGCRERRKILDIIRKRGDFVYNTRQELNGGELVVVRRPPVSKPRIPEEFACCPNCHGLYNKRTLIRHFKVCSAGAKKGQRNLFIMGRKVVGRIHQLANEKLREVVFPVLREDEVVRAIRYDELAILYGNHFCTRHRCNPQSDDMIRARLRYIGRMLLAARQIDPNVKDFASLMVPSQYDTVISAINKEAGLKPNGLYSAPATAMGMTTLCKVAAEIWRVECLKRSDSASKAAAEDFLSLFKLSVSATINRTVAENQSEMKRHKKIILPTAADISLFCDYLKNCRRRSLKALLSSNSSQERLWLELAGYTVISILVFNRRRVGEIERMQLCDLNNMQQVDERTDSHIYNTLSARDKLIVKQYVRVEIRGKLGRTVPVLLNKELQLCIDAIVDNRVAVGVSSSNPYVFGIPSTDERVRYLRACPLMRKFSTECGAENPASLRGTQLRKHIATQCVIHNLSDSEVGDLANFMGHAEKIHREHYRLPVVARDIAQISRLLRYAQGNEDDNEGESDDSESTEMQDNIVDGTASELQERQKKTNAVKDSHTPVKQDCGAKKQRKNFGSPSTPKFKKPIKRIRWTTPHKQALHEAFREHLKKGTLPSKRECEMAQRRYAVFRMRTSESLKTCVQNELNRRKRLGF